MNCNILHYIEKKTLFIWRCFYFLFGYVSISLSLIMHFMSTHRATQYHSSSSFVIKLIVVFWFAVCINMHFPTTTTEGMSAWCSNITVKPRVRQRRLCCKFIPFQFGRTPNANSHTIHTNGTIFVFGFSVVASCTNPGIESPSLFELFYHARFCKRGRDRSV